MTIQLRDPATGTIYEVDEAEASAAITANGFERATPDQVAEYDHQKAEGDKGLLEQVGDTARAAGEGLTRQFERVQDLGTASGLFSNSGNDPYDPAPEQGYSPSSPEARQLAEDHPVAAAVGSAVPMLPAMALGGGAGVLVDAALGGAAGEAEAAWQQDRDFSAESAFQNVGVGLLLGGGLMAGAAGVRGLTRVGRNLLTEAEHTASARAASDLLEEASNAERKANAASMTADDIARAGPDDIGVQYLRDNADEITDRIATEQAKAAQELLDSYGEISKLRPDTKEIAELIPDDRVGQAQWITHVRQVTAEDLADLPGLSKELRERVAELGNSRDPAAWFTQASELGDELAKARAAIRDVPQEAVDLAGGAAEGATDAATLIDKARQRLIDGLSQPTLWGDAAATEAQRAEAYARRSSDHIAAFETHFTSQSGKDLLADPGKFRSYLQADGIDGALARRALENTMEAARATADAAARFGRPKEAARIMGAIDALERGSGQAQAVQAARAVSRETPKAGPSNAEAALAWMGRKAADRVGSMAGGVVGGMVGGGPVGAVLGAGAGEVAQRALEGMAARSGVFKAMKGFATQAGRGTRRSVSELLSPVVQVGVSAGKAIDTGLLASAPVASGVTAENFQATRDHITKMAEDPRYFGEVMGESFGALSEHAPDVAKALAQQTSRAVNYLANNAPGGKTGGPFSQTIPVGEDDLYEFQQKFAGATDGDFIRAGLANGTLTPQAIDAFQNVAPTRYRRLQMDVFHRLVQMNSMGIPVPDYAREQLDMLLDLDGGGEPGLSWNVAEKVYAAQQGRQQQLQDRKLNQADSEQAAVRQSGALNTLTAGTQAQ